jgi:hypothetical protein
MREAALKKAEEAVFRSHAVEMETDKGRIFIISLFIFYFRSHAVEIETAMGHILQRPPYRELMY